MNSNGAAVSGDERLLSKIQGMLQNFSDQIQEKLRISSQIQQEFATGLKEQVMTFVTEKFSAQACAIKTGFQEQNSTLLNKDNFQEQIDTLRVSVHAAIGPEIPGPPPQTTPEQQDLAAEGEWRTVTRKQTNKQTNVLWVGGFLPRSDDETKRRLQPLVGTILDFNRISQGSGIVKLPTEEAVQKALKLSGRKHDFFVDGIRVQKAREKTAGQPKMATLDKKHQPGTRGLQITVQSAKQQVKPNGGERQATHQTNAELRKQSHDGKAERPHKEKGPNATTVQGTRPVILFSRQMREQLNQNTGNEAPQSKPGRNPTTTLPVVNRQDTLNSARERESAAGLQTPARQEPEVHKDTAEPPMPILGTARNQSPQITEGQRQGRTTDSSESGASAPDSPVTPPGSHPRKTWNGGANGQNDQQGTPTNSEPVSPNAQEKIRHEYDQKPGGTYTYGNRVWNKYQKEHDTGKMAVETDGRGMCFYSAVAKGGINVEGRKLRDEEWRLVKQRALQYLDSQKFKGLRITTFAINNYADLLQAVDTNPQAIRDSLLKESEQADETTIQLVALALRMNVWVSYADAPEQEATKMFSGDLSKKAKADQNLEVLYRRPGIPVYDAQFCRVGYSEGHYWVVQKTQGTNLQTLPRQSRRAGRQSTDLGNGSQSGSARH